MEALTAVGCIIAYIFIAWLLTFFWPFDSFHVGWYYDDEDKDV